MKTIANVSLLKNGRLVTFQKVVKTKRENPMRQLGIAPDLLRAGARVLMDKAAGEDWKEGMGDAAAAPITIPETIDQYELHAETVYCASDADVLVALADAKANHEKAEGLGLNRYATGYAGVPAGIGLSQH